MRKFINYSSKKVILFVVLVFGVSILPKAQTKTIRQGPKYDTIIRRHITKPIAKPVAKQEIVLPVPEFINQPYYYDKDNNRLIKLEAATALMVTKKKTLGLKGAKQFLNMDGSSSRVRFTTKDIVFFIKTSGDVIDLTSYIKMYKFMPDGEKREVTISSKEGVFNDKEDQKGKLIGISVKPVSKDIYIIQFSEKLAAGEYGFVWLKNMELKEFSVFAFGIDWKSSD
ncbi:MAG: hypothetical protein ABI416_06585 [Ginsengibacter sp.]